MVKIYYTFRNISNKLNLDRVIFFQISFHLIRTFAFFTKGNPDGCRSAFLHSTFLAKASYAKQPLLVEFKLFYFQKKLKVFLSYLKTTDRKKRNYKRTVNKKHFCSKLGCGSGKFWNETANTCTRCPRGTYSSNLYARVCSECPEGTTTNRAGTMYSRLCRPCKEQHF